MAPAAPWQIGRVTNTVRRTAALWKLVVQGKEILTTSEHPFWVMGEGWVNANEIKINDKLRTLKGVAVVEQSEAADASAEVFNVTIEPSHTYFVGCDDWGFVVWSHNARACWERGLNGTNKTAREATRGKGFDSPKTTELHHPLKKARTWKEYWEQRGWKWEDVKDWKVEVDKDAHQGMEKARLWEKRLKEDIAKAEAAQGGELLNKAQTAKVAQKLLNEFWDWLQPRKQ